MAESTNNVGIDNTKPASRDDKDDLSDASYLSDVEEVDHMKTDARAVDELLFDDSYFRQEKPADDVCDDAQEESLSDSAATSPWERMADWIHCFCVVTFDLEIGQMIEVFIFTLCMYIPYSLYIYIFLIAGSLPKPCPAFRTGQNIPVLFSISRL